MAYKSEESIKLYQKLSEMGYPPEFCELITRELNTTWTANRMLGYLRHVPHQRQEDVVDEMLAILSDRARIREKKEMEFYQGKINEIYNNGLFEDEES